jgi:hypothetical protein
MSAAVATALAFNLVCTETSVTTFNNEPFSTTAISTVYSIDLKAALYCEHDRKGEYMTSSCKSIQPLASITPGAIVFTYYHSRPDQPSYFTAMSVNRVTGELKGYTDAGAMKSATSGQCVKQPFTGLPKSKF